MQCAECALQSVLGDLSHTYFVGNAPMGHMVIQPAEKMPDIPSYKVYLLLFIYFKRTNTLFSSVYKLCTSFFTDNFILCCCLNVSVCDYYSLCWSLSFCQQFFFKSQVIASNKFTIGKCEDFVWVTKDELMEYFPERAEFLNKMIISWCTSPIWRPCMPHLIAFWTN